MSSTPTVAEYVVARLGAIGIDHAFGVPGDYAFPFDDALESSPVIKSILSANELNAAYAADGYARVKGAGLVCTTYGVGELSAINGIMGAKVERLPVFHVVGQPSMRLQRGRAVAHHTLGDGVFGNFRGLSEAATCVSADLTPANAISEMERVISSALRECRPAYITAAQDLALMPIEGTPPPSRSMVDYMTGTSNPDELAAAVKAVRARLEAAKAPFGLVSYLVGRYRLQGRATGFLEASGLGFVTTPMSKGMISEAHPLFMGVYSGAMSHPGVLAAVKAADLVIDIGGTSWADFDTGMWTAQVDATSLVRLYSDHVEVGGKTYGPVFFGDMLAALTEGARAFTPPTREEAQLLPLSGADADAVSQATFVSRLQRFLKPRDVVVAETGFNSSGSVPGLAFPDGAEYHNQVLWGSIGWATPAAFGASLADTSRRTILVTGDGSHQLTANDIGAMGKHGAKPIIFVVNNGSFGVEEALARTQGHAYDVLAPWEYASIPAAMGCVDWFTAKVETVGDLDRALAEAGNGGRAAYIEVVTGPAGIPGRFPLEVIDSLYLTEPV